MPDPELPTIVGRGLAGELRRLRQTKKLSVRAVATQLDWQGSKLSRMETGQQRIRVADLASLLVIYGVTGAERKRLLAMAERSGEPGWWETYGAGLTPWSRTLLQLETDASAIFNFEPLLVPGLLQTPDYTRAVMKACGVPDESAQLRVAARLGRQALLTQDEPPTLHVIVDEGALRRVVGSPWVMARQLRHLIEASARPRVTIHLVPLAVGGYTGLDGPFMILDFDRHKPVVHLEQKMASMFLEDAEQVTFFRRQVDRLVDVALDPTESLRLLGQIALEHERE
ncbi:helix-turn-helix transcriptional regulator [Plantactinospora sp. B6F1]|uniref:helix-turn-helix domain-containing protein n=1 Tax=Plantactinospora sp. B6F1 TaxID=3158971 RepID=UPI0032D97A57